MSTPSTINQQILLGDDYLLVWIEGFLKERTAQNLTTGTVRYYKDNLIPFANYLESQGVKYISQITPSLIRDFLLFLEEKGHKPGGVHSFFRSIKVFLRWYWDEVEPDIRDPINKVFRRRTVPNKDILITQTVSRPHTMSKNDKALCSLLRRRSYLNWCKKNFS